MVQTDHHLSLPEIEPTFFFSLALDSFAENKTKLNQLMASQGWHTGLKTLNADSEFSSSFTPINSDLPNYRDTPSPEKRPIDEVYFDKHSSLSTQYSIEEVSKEGSFDIKGVTIRLFEHGGITARCRFRQTASIEDRNIDDAVNELRGLRERGHKIMYDAVSEFLFQLDKAYPAVGFRTPNGVRESNNWERYEYINIDIESSQGSQPINIYEIGQSDDRLQELRELVGFCRMSKTYAWPNHAPDYLRWQMDKDLGNRKDELWFINSQRFIRYFPDHDVKETSEYVQDILLSTEVLLSLRAVYKKLIDEIRQELQELPATLTDNVDHPTQIDEEEIDDIQEHLSLVSYRLSRSRFPSSIRYHVNGQFAVKLLTHVESELQLPHLSETLEIEMEKFHGAVDSFSAIITHHRNVKIQRILMFLTVVVGLAGAAITLLSVIF